MLIFTNTTAGIEINRASENKDNKLLSTNYIIYNVKPDDSLYKISRQFNTTIQKLKTINNLNSNLIYVGQDLKIPETNNNDQIYYVQPGDSLYKISRKFNITVSQLKIANNLSSNFIYVDQKLVIPGAGNSNNSDDIPESNYQSISGTIQITNKTLGTSKLEQKGESDDINKGVLLTDYNLYPEYQKSEIIVKYKPVINSQALEKMESANNLVTINQLGIDDGQMVHYQVSEDKNIEELLERYNQLENVEWAEPNYIYYPTATPTDKYYNNQWGMTNLNMEAAWDQQKGKETVRVAVLDTGVITDHPDLKENLAQGADFIGGNKSFPIESYNVTDYDPTDETGYNEGGSHGTHVAGIIGAVTNNNLGVAGTNWNIDLLPVRVLKQTGGTSWDIAEGIYYAIDKKADIINLSLGSNHDSRLQHDAVKKAYEEEITVVAAAGNDGAGKVYYPAAYPETIAVSAVGKTNQKASYSNYSPEVDVAAPGGDYGQPIYSTWGYYQEGQTISDYNGMIGTSMAAPHVSGVAALLTASGVSAPENIRDRLTETAVDLGEKGKDNYYGSGLVDAYGALLGKKMSSPKVFAAEKSGNDLIVKSEVKSVANNSSFTLEKVKNSADHVIGWRDVNNNNIVDSGDYFSEKRINEDSNIDLTLYYISKTSLQNGYNVIN